MTIDLTSISVLLATVGALAIAANHPRRCTARKSTTGEQCGHYALRGSNVCKYHGGAAPQVQAAISARRMHDLYGPLIASLARCLESNDLDAVLKSCAIISRHYLTDTEAGRLPSEHRENGPDLGWVEYLDAEELAEVSESLQSHGELMATYEALARERMDRAMNGWKKPRALAAAPTVIDVTPIDDNGNRRGDGP